MTILRSGARRAGSSGVFCVFCVYCVFCIFFASFLSFCDFFRPPTFLRLKRLKRFKRFKRLKLLCTDLDEWDIIQIYAWDIIDLDVQSACFIPGKYRSLYWDSKSYRRRKSLVFCIDIGRCQQLTPPESRKMWSFRRKSKNISCVFFCCFFTFFGKISWNF